MNVREIKRLCKNPEYLEQAATWFSKKWGIPAEAYKESIEECILQKTGIPQWYIILNSKGEIIAGAGVIQNDFHDRKDLSPNVCALFVEEEYRNQGLAKYILDVARKDIGNMGVERLYLITGHTTFYERCGWEFLTMVNEIDGSPARMYTAATLR